LKAQLPLLRNNLLSLAIHIFVLLLTLALIPFGNHPIYYCAIVLVAFAAYIMLGYYLLKPGGAISEICSLSRLPVSLDLQLEYSACYIPGKWALIG